MVTLPVVIFSWRVSSQSSLISLNIRYASYTMLCSMVPCSMFVKISYLLCFLVWVSESLTSNLFSLHHVSGRIDGLSMQKCLVFSTVIGPISAFSRLREVEFFLSVVIYVFMLWAHWIFKTPRMLIDIVWWMLWVPAVAIVFGWFIWKIIKIVGSFLFFLCCWFYGLSLSCSLVF